MRAFPRRKLLALIIVAVWALISQAVRPSGINQAHFADDFAFLLLLLAAGGYLMGTVRMVRALLKLGSAAWIILVACDLISQAVMRNGIHKTRLTVDCIFLLLLLLFGIFPSASEIRKHLLQFAPLALSGLTISALICWYAPSLFEPVGRTWIDVLPITAWAYLFAHLAEACRVAKPALGMSLLILDVCIKWPSDVAGVLVVVALISVACLWLNTQRRPPQHLQLSQPEVITK